MVGGELKNNNNDNNNNNNNNNKNNKNSKNKNNNNNNNNKGTSKCHKMDEKSTHFAVQVSPLIFGLQKTLAHYT